MNEVHMRTRNQSSDAGFTLIEVTIATVLLVVGVMGFMGAIFASQMMVRATKENNRANAALVTAVEEFRRECQMDFDKTLRDHAGDTTFERKIEIGPDGQEIAIDIETRTTTSESAADNTATVTEIQSKVDASLDRTQMDETTVSTNVVEAQALLDQAIADEDAARAALLIAEEGGDKKAAEKAVDTAEKERNKAEKLLEKYQTQHGALAEAKTADPMRMSGQTVELRKVLIKEYRAGRITRDEAIARWRAAGDGSGLVVSEDGTVQTATVHKYSDGASSSETFRSDASGDTLHTSTKTHADGSKKHAKLKFSKFASQVLSQRVVAGGAVETTIKKTTQVQPEVPTDTFVDLDMVARIGEDAKMKMSVLVDETMMDPPVDLNGDGDYLDTNVPTNEMTASVLRVLVEWQSAGGKRSIETTTIVARGEVEK